MTEKTSSSVARTVEAFKNSPSLHPLVVGHMCKQDKSRFTFSKRYFALYEGGLLAYYSHERAFKEDVKKHKGVVRDTAHAVVICYTIIAQCYAGICYILVL